MMHKNRENSVAMTLHEPVLLKKTCENLHISKDKKFIDATLGAAGHTKEILSQGGQVLGIDQDESMLRIASDNLKDFCKDRACPSFKLVKGNFDSIDSIAKNNNFYPVDGVLMDLGVSSFHFDDTNRGFSFRYPQADLDMRLDRSLGVKAKDLLNSLSEKELSKLFESKSIAKRVLEKRKLTSFDKVASFLEIFPKKIPGKTHPATKAFMDLRIAVNSELQIIKDALPSAAGLLKSDGRLVVISFHSGEDRLVKNIFNQLVQTGDYELVNKKPIIPSESEVKRNPKSRSSKMRVIKKK